MTAENEGAGRGGDDPAAPGGGLFPQALRAFEASVAEACAGSREWPEQIAAGVCAGVDFAIANAEVTRAWTTESMAESGSGSDYEAVISRLAELLRERAPSGARPPVSTEKALVAGIVGLVGDHIRIGRLDRLEDLRPELVLLALLPYLGFAEAKQWAGRYGGPSTGDH